MKTWKLPLKICAALTTLAVLSGCSHNIQLTPDLASLRDVQTGPVIDKNVAYFISQEDLLKQVTTPGGGGDKVTYKPYADTEAALNTVLSKMFTRVYSMNSIDDQQYISDKNISFIFVPKLLTNSSSKSAFTWPPTEFTIKMSCEALDNTGRVVWQKSIESSGNAKFSEFKSDFSLAARRASEEAFSALLNEIKNADFYE